MSTRLSPPVGTGEVAGDVPPWATASGHPSNSPSAPPTTVKQEPGTLGEARGRDTKSFLCIYSVKSEICRDVRQSLTPSSAFSSQPSPSHHFFCPCPLSRGPLAQSVKWGQRRLSHGACQAQCWDVCWVLNGWSLAPRPLRGVPMRAAALPARPPESAVVRADQASPRMSSGLCSTLCPQNGSYHYSHYYNQYALLRAPCSNVRSAQPHLEGPHLQPVLGWGESYSYQGATAEADTKCQEVKEEHKGVFRKEPYCLGFNRHRRW